MVLKTALIMTGMKAYQAVQEGFSVEDLTTALWAHPAVLALGVDLGLCAVGFSAWNFLGPRVAGAGAKKGVNASAAAPVSGKEKRKEAKAARKSGGLGRR